MWDFINEKFVCFFKLVLYVVLFCFCRVLFLINNVIEVVVFSNVRGKFWIKRFFGL